MTSSLCGGFTLLTQETVSRSPLSCILPRVTLPYHALMKTSRLAVKVQQPKVDGAIQHFSHRLNESWYPTLYWTNSVNLALQNITVPVYGKSFSTCYSLNFQLKNGYQWFQFNGCQSTEKPRRNGYCSLQITYSMAITTHVEAFIVY